MWLLFFLVGDIATVDSFLFLTLSTFWFSFSPLTGNLDSSINLNSSAVLGRVKTWQLLLSSLRNVILGLIFVIMNANMFVKISSFKQPLLHSREAFVMSECILFLHDSHSCCSPSASKNFNPSWIKCIASYVKTNVPYCEHSSQLSPEHDCYCYAAEKESANDWSESLPHNKGSNLSERSETNL